MKSNKYMSRKREDKSATLSIARYRLLHQNGRNWRLSLTYHTHTIPVAIPPTKCLFYSTTFSIKKTDRDTNCTQA